MNEQMNRDTRRAADRTRADTERASNRGIEFNDESKLGSSPTITERELANRLTDTMSGRDDPFYKFPPEEPTNNDPCDWGVHDEGSNALPSGGGGLGSGTLVVDYIDSDNTAQQATFVIVP